MPAAQSADESSKMLLKYTALDLALPQRGRKELC